MTRSTADLTPRYRRVNGYDAYFCAVCNEEFRPSTGRLSKIRNASYSDEKREEKRREAWEKARDDFIEHWNEEHW